MIICAGEILADMIGKNENGHIDYECFVGGAPFNVACCLKKLSAKCGFCGNVGNDVIGDMLVRISEEQGFDYLSINKSEDKNTTLAFVSVDDEGERSFSFYRKNTADAFFSIEKAEEIVNNANIIHIGSLMLSCNMGQYFAKRLVKLAHEKGKYISFDVNYRDDIFNSQKEAVDIYKEYINDADIIKFSLDEICMFSDKDDINEALLNMAGEKKIVFLTLGSGGSMAAYKGEIYTAENIKAERIVDTNGAGDAFMAGALYALDQGENDMEKILKWGNACGSLTVSQKGAYPTWDIEKVKALI